MLKITFTLKSKNPKVQWAKLKTVFRTFEPELQIIGRDLVKYFTDDVFNTEGEIFNEKWPELSPKYASYKAKKYRGRGLLQASGEMKRGYRLMTNSQYAIIKNVKSYAKYHQSGTGKMPKRMLVKVDSEKSRMVQNEFRKHIQERIAKALQ